MVTLLWPPWNENPNRASEYQAYSLTAIQFCVIQGVLTSCDFKKQYLVSQNSEGVLLMKYTVQHQYVTLVMFYKQHCTGNTSLTFSIFEGRCLIVA